MSHLLTFLFTTPWPYVLILTGLGLYLVHRSMRAAVLLWLLAVLMILQTSAAVFTALAQPLIAASNQLSLNSGCLEAYPLVVVLGGGLLSKDRLSEASRERVERAAQFLLEKPGKTVIVSGGPTLEGQPSTESALGEHVLKQLVPNADVLREERSLTTYQNAVHTHALIEQLHLSPQIILVTSVFHMPRAAAVFTAQGFSVCALASYPPSLNLAQSVAFSNAAPVAMLLHEYLGAWYYSWRGWMP